MIIADAGSTGITWSALHGEMSWQTRGFNPNYHPTQVFEELLRPLRKDDNFVSHASCIVYYGTGCFETKSARKVQDLLDIFFGESHIEVHSDLLGAARASCGDASAIIGILGTGSSCALYREGQLTLSPAAIFPHGNEASGYDLARRILLGANAGKWTHLDPKLTTRLLASAPPGSLDDPSTISNTAGLLPRLWPLLTAEEQHDLCWQSLDDFRQKKMAVLEEELPLPLNFVGSVALLIQHILRPWAEYHKLPIGHITGNPMPRLLRYHQHKLSNKKE